MRCASPVGRAVHAALLLLAVAPACALESKHRASQRGRTLRLINRRALADKIAADPELRRALSDVLPTNLVLRNVAIAPAPDGLGFDKDPGSMSPTVANTQDMVANIEAMLDVLGDDNYVRNFTQMCFETKELAAWLEQSAAGRVDMFLAAENGTAPATFLLDMDRFIKGWREMQVDFMQQLAQIYVRFVVAVPEKMRVANMTPAKMLENVTRLAASTRAIVPANMEHVKPTVYCPVLKSMIDTDAATEKAMKRQMLYIDASKQSIPSMGQTFAAMLPEGDPASQEMTPRLLFMVSEMMEYSKTMLASWGHFNHEFNHKFASFARTRLGCLSGLEATSSKQSAGFSLAPGAVPASLIVLALSAALGPNTWGRHS